MNMFGCGIFAVHCSGKWHQYNGKKENKIQPDQLSAVIDDISEHPVMDKPVETYDKKTKQEAQEFREQVCQCGNKRPFSNTMPFQFRNFDLDDQQCNGNGKNGIAEKNEAFYLEILITVVMELLHLKR